MPRRLSCLCIPALPLLHQREVWGLCLSLSGMLRRNCAQISQLPRYAFRPVNLLLCSLHGSHRGKKGPYFGA